jgi:uncharacterized protein YacL
MYWNEVKKISAAGGFIVSMIMLAVNLLRGYDLLYSTYLSLIVLVVSSVLFLICFHTIGNILSSYLAEKKKEAAKEEKKRKREEAKQKLADLKKKRTSIEDELANKFDEMSNNEHA